MCAGVAVGGEVRGRVGRRLGQNRENPPGK